MSENFKYNHEGKKPNNSGNAVKNFYQTDGGNSKPATAPAKPDVRHPGQGGSKQNAKKNRFEGMNKKQDSSSDGETKA